MLLVSGSDTIGKNASNGVTRQEFDSTIQQLNSKVQQLASRLDDLGEIAA